MISTLLAMYLVAGLIMAGWLMWQPDNEDEPVSWIDIVNLILFWPFVIVVVLKMTWDERHGDDS